jgi:hypothetical protein
MQILVLGMHRSGTSLTTRFINMMGAYFAPEGLALGLTPDNPKGFWERRDVMLVNDQLLHHFNCSWEKIDRLDAENAGGISPKLQHTIKTILLGMDAHRPWVMKDPRLCVTLPAWLPSLEVPVAVIAWRNPLEVARSLQLRNNMSVEYALALWEYYAVHLIRNAAALPKIFVSYEAMKEMPVENIEALYNGLQTLGVQGLRLPSEREILAFLDTRLHRAKEADVKLALSDHQQHLSAMLRGKKAFNPKMDVSANARRLMEKPDQNKKTA